MAKKESKQKKMNVRVDFTPMVDMLMLLITFFMLCTSLSKPQTMELTMPSNDENTQDDQKNEAKASETITLYVAADNKIYYGAGIPNYNDPTWIKETTWGSQGIRKVLREHATENGIYGRLPEPSSGQPPPRFRHFSPLACMASPNSRACDK